MQNSDRLYRDAKKYDDRKQVRIASNTASMFRPKISNSRLTAINKLSTESRFNDGDTIFCPIDQIIHGSRSKTPIKGNQQSMANRSTTANKVQTVKLSRNEMWQLSGIQRYANDHGDV